MSESFDTLFQKALAAAEKLRPLGMHNYESTVRWPRFYVFQSGASFGGGQQYFMATEANKNGKTWKGVFVETRPGLRRPGKAKHGNMRPPRLGEPAGYKPIFPQDIPPEVIERFREKG